MDTADGVYTIDCKGCDGKYVSETKSLLTTRVREHRDEMEKIGNGMPFTRVEQKGIRNRETQISHHGSYGQGEPYDGLGQSWDSSEGK